MLRSSGRVTLRPAPPPRVAATWISLTLPGSTSRGCQYATDVPSGENVGCPSPPRSLLVTLRVCPEASSSTCTLVCDPSPECGEAARTNSSDVPSGDQVTGDAGGPGGHATGRLQRPDVRRFASPPPDGTVQMWLGIAAAPPNTSSFSTPNASFDPPGPFFPPGPASLPN